MAFDCLAFHERAVRTPSHEEVDAMRSLLVETLADAGASPTVDDAGNTLATVAGARDGPHLVFNTHIDTVPPHVPCRVDGDVVRGRGACDAKASLAAMVDAFVGATPAAGRLTLAVTPDEERHSTGAAALEPAAVAPDAGPADAYVVGEPTGLAVCHAARGRFEGTITLTGVAAHAAEPQSGVNAIRAAAPVLQALETYDERQGPGTHERLGAPTLTATMIEGGEAANQVPETCRITFDRRSVPPETATGFLDGLRTHLASWLPEAVELTVALADRETPFLEAWATDADATVVRALERAGGGDRRPFGAATEASYFASRAPTAVFGPGVLADEEGAVAHAAREYVDRREVERAASVLRATVADLLG